MIWCDFCADKAASCPRKTRKRLYQALGRAKEGDMSWIDFIALMTNEEWATVSLRGNMVKKVLGGGTWFSLK